MSAPTTPGHCIHSKYVLGCASCAYRWLKHHGYVKQSRIFDHYSGLNRLRLPICSICEEPFDPEKKHMCDGCGSTFSRGKPSGDPAYSPSGKEQP